MISHSSQAKRFRWTPWVRIRLLTFALACTIAGLAPQAQAVSASFHPDLVRALRDLDTARGPAAYTALRDVWASWDRADPLQVEEALRTAEQNPRLAAPARVYAGLLHAYARRRRGDLAAASAKIDQLGFVKSWLLVGPFDNEGKAGLAQEFGPEVEAGQPVVFGRAYSGKERPVRWREVPRAFPFGWIDTGALLRPERKICAVLKTFVRANKDTRAPRTISLWIGSGGAFRAWWNGAQVLEDEAYRSHDADRFATRVTLQPGANDLTVKVCGDDTAPIVSVRLGDAQGGPNASVSASAALTDSEASAKAVKDSKKAAVPGGLEGPVQVFERTTKKGARAGELFAYARYLEMTGGDDPAEHQARDLARRAADREPTVERLLLAGELAEDRNQRKIWVDRAEALAKRTGAAPNAVLLAQADLALSGPNWRSALAYLDQLLALDPDDVDAIHARAQLHNDAGLKRTALASLERAVERNPHSVNLLNMLASQLRVLGRDTEAAEVEERYAAMRFDDHTFLSSKIDLAMARRDREAADRWVDRLLRSDPDSQWAHGVAARAYRSLGQPDRAVATYKKALELAPEDVGTLRTLSDLQGELGRRNEQLALLQDILRIRPQDREVRQYLEFVKPDKPRPDEAYAWNEKRFLRFRHAPAAGETHRTLRDLTVSTVFDNGLSSQFRQVVFQPLTDAAAAVSRQYSFSYQADRQAVQLRGARVFRGDGRVDQAIEYGESAANDPSISMYTSARNFTIQLPRLEPGDVVELRYRVDDVTPRNEFADYFGEVVYLQSDSPVQNAEYVLITPKSRKFYIDQQVPGLKQTVNERGKQKIHRFFADKIAPLAREPAMPPWPEVLGFVHVSTYKSWQELGKWYWGLVKDQFDLDDETRKLARDIAKGKTSDLDKVKAVYNWVIENTRYVALEFGIYGYKPRRCVQTVARGWGDCKDKATVIVTLLEELGIPSTIVILRTQLRGGFRSKVPSLAPFDHAIVYVPSLNLYLDGTAEYTGVDELPKMDLGALGLLVNRGDAKLVTLPEADPAKNEVERKVVATVTREGNAKLDLDYVTRGVAAPDWRRRYHADSTRRERINNDLAQEFPGFDVVQGPQGITASGLDDFEKDVQISVHGNAPGFARREGSRLSMAVTTGVRLTPTYASLSKRKQDVRIIGFSTVDDTFVVKIPAGMKVVSTPDPKSADTRFGRYSVKVEQQPGQVTVHSTLAIKTSRVAPKDYAQWRAFCAAADLALSPRLVVEP